MFLIMKKRISIFLSFFLSLFLVACCNGKNGEEVIAENVQTFASAYYNWDFPAAAQLATDDSQLWLRYLASQVDTVDIAAIRDKEKAAEVEILSLDMEGENSGNATVVVRNYLAMDSIGKIPVCRDADTVTIEIVMGKINCNSITYKR